jgi:hypothetical protein
MAYLYEIMNTKYKNSTQAEKETEIRKEMIRGLVKFTRGDLQIEIVQSIQYARRKREKLDWKVMLEKAIEREMIQGMPQVERSYNTEQEPISKPQNRDFSDYLGDYPTTEEIIKELSEEEEIRKPERRELGGRARLTHSKQAK